MSEIKNVNEIDELNGSEILTPEQIAEIEAQKDQELFGDNVKKIGGCAVVTVDNETIAVELPVTYPQLVTAIVRHKYDPDQTEAILANIASAQTMCASEEKADEYLNEYTAYNSWRSKAKSIAKEVLGIEE
jgi:hypothetical protein